MIKTMTNLLVLLTAIASLLANPNVQANPALLSRVEAIQTTATALVEEYTAVDAQAHPVPFVQGQDTQSNPEGASLGAATSTNQCWYIYPGGWVHGTFYKSKQALVDCSLVANCAATNSCPLIP